MALTSLNSLNAWLEVARRRSFAAAARELGVSPSALSQSVRQLEARLGVSLLTRTSRSVALTDAGHALITALQPAMGDMNRAWDALSIRKGKPRGLLRINIPRVAQPILAPFVTGMARRYPDVTVELFTDDGLADVVKEGFDAGIRAGDDIAGGMVVVRLTPPFRTLIAASPD